LIERILPERPRWYQVAINYAFCAMINFPRPWNVLGGLQRCQDKRLFLIENGRETFIPLTEIRLLRKRSPGSVSYWHVARAQHLMAQAVNFSKYVTKVVEFLEGKSVVEEASHHLEETDHSLSPGEAEHRV